MLRPYTTHLPRQPTLRYLPRLPDGEPTPGPFPSTACYLEAESSPQPARDSSRPPCHTGVAIHLQGPEDLSSFDSQRRRRCLSPRCTIQAQRPFPGGAAPRFALQVRGSQAPPRQDHVMWIPRQDDTREAMPAVVALTGTIFQLLHERAIRYCAVPTAPIRSATNRTWMAVLPTSRLLRILLQPRFHHKQDDTIKPICVRRPDVSGLRPPRALNEVDGATHGSQGLFKPAKPPHLPRQHCRFRPPCRPKHSLASQTPSTTRRHTLTALRAPTPARSPYPRGRYLQVLRHAETP